MVDSQEKKIEHSRLSFHSKEKKIGQFRHTLHSKDLSEQEVRGKYITSRDS